VSFVIDSYIQANHHFYIVVLRPLSPDMTVQNEINKSKDAFLSTVSHELRTPLFGLLGTISLLHSQIMDQSTLDDVTQMEINVMSLLSIVNNMIDFYLLNQLNAAPVYFPFDTSKLVADICERMNGFKHKGMCENLNFNRKYNNK
jgi:signal transduction histidine kinase